MRKVNERKTLEFLQFLAEREVLYPQLNLAFDHAINTGWEFAVVNQTHGYCNWARKEFCVPSFIFARPIDYQLYYLAHELAHVFAGSAAKHGPQFMAEFKRICPTEYHHYELEYKFSHALEAGIVPIDF